MCDFSQYGEPCDEWTIIQEQLKAPPAIDDILDMKRITNEGREKAATLEMQDLLQSITMVDHTIVTRDGYDLKARSYRPAGMSTSQKLPTYLHFHGGGFLFGTLDSEDAICSRIAIMSDVVVLNVCYRHTPEHKWPTAWNDAEDAFEWLHENMLQLGRSSEQVVVGGVSAGAWLTASLVLAQRLGAFAVHLPLAAGQVLMIPCLVHEQCYGPQLAKLSDPARSSYKQNELAPILPLSRSRTFLELLDVRNAVERDLKLNPGNALQEHVRHLPPTVFGIAGLDILRDEGLLYAKQLSEAGVPTQINLFQGLPHGFRRFGAQLSASRRWDNVMAGGIRWALSNPASTGEFRIETE
ncbi:hypothetical protein KVT40_000278 [Elsinoe batatas]|uniref:Alpha/beta hydrolase fold-3 domain-containing protein n=1 Tax=Elsinoe batatas TaxID=2601811 RepID=A0A8K0PL01_9PEZI|nr:hypothetical protein KVT40_000278 [Elsinoe batatas]